MDFNFDTTDDQTQQQCDSFWVDLGQVNIEEASYQVDKFSYQGVKQTLKKLSSEDYTWRTREPYTLDEILYTTFMLLESNYDIARVAKSVKRFPQEIIYRYVYFRPIRKDGTYDPNSVETEQESLTYFDVD